MVTGKQYAAEAMKVYNLNPKAGYIWGKMNEVWTSVKQEALKKKYNSDPAKYSDLKLGAQLGKKWIGHRVWDCSGLTKYCGLQLGLSYAHGSNSSWRNDTVHKGKKEKTTKLPVGAWVYTGSSSSDHPHIGIVVDSEWVVEAQGTRNGVVKTKISDKKWTYWGLGKGITFDFIPGLTVGETGKQESAGGGSSSSTIKYPTLRRGAKGDLVVQLQRILSKDGSSLVIDGIFGSGTQSAVRAFQKRHGLEVDGIVGPKTWNALLKLI